MNEPVYGDHGNVPVATPGADELARELRRLGIYAGDPIRRQGIAVGLHTRGHTPDDVRKAAKRIAARDLRDGAAFLAKLVRDPDRFGEWLSDVEDAAQAGAATWRELRAEAKPMQNLNPAAPAARDDELMEGPGISDLMREHGCTFLEACRMLRESRGSDEPEGSE